MTRKCISPDCTNQVESGHPWCEKCLDELGNYIEQHPIGYVPRRVK